MSYARRKLELYAEEIKEDLLVHKASVRFLSRRYGVCEATITRWLKDKGIRK